MSGGPWTSHGHPVDGVTVVDSADRPRAVARCGGPALCSSCSTEAAEMRYQAEAGRRYQTLESLYHRALAQAGEARAEAEELKQWASDACELLHEVRSINAWTWAQMRGTPVDNKILDLLQRMESP